MKLKINKKLALTQEQLREITELVMTEPDMGWNYNEETGLVDYVMNCEVGGEYGIYYYRVNLSWNLITLQNVE